MGCCFSSTTTTKRNKRKSPTHPTDHSLSPHKPPDHHHQPPLPAKLTLEEETVKEVVLSENPVLLPKPIIPQQTLTPISKSHEQEQQNPKTNQPQEPEAEAEAVSEYSDICSFSGSVSTATTVTEKRENEVTSRDHTRENSSYAYNNNKRRLNGRHNNGSSPVKPGLQRKRPYVAGGGEKRGRVNGSGSFSPAQRSVPSPERSGKVGMGVRGRGMVQGRNGGERTIGGGVRRVSGDSSCRRRSSSPATCRDGGGGVGRSPGKRTGSAGSKSRELSEANSSACNNEVDGKQLGLGTETEEKKMGGNGGVSEGGNESIDNPLVSLECFIFL